MNSILEALESHDGLRVRDIEPIANLRYGQIEQVLKYLSVENPAPVIKIGNTWRRTPVHYQMDRAKIRRLTEQREGEWQEVQRYVDAGDCLMRFLAEALDDPAPQACGEVCPLPRRANRRLFFYGEHCHQGGPVPA